MVEWRKEEILRKNEGEATMNYVYIVKCADGTLYTGWTNDLAHRMKTHNAGKGAKYTRSRLPVELVYFEQCETPIDAQKREFRLKKLTRAQKLALIRSQSELG